VDLTCYKVVVLKDKDCTHNFIDIVTKNSSTGKYLKISENFTPEKSDYSYNIYEVEAGLVIIFIEKKKKWMAMVDHCSTNPPLSDLI
jgi:hypothetical protein